ncbi:16042_t:CDS:1, partial [Dentiscutata heterogama]
KLNTKFINGNFKLNDECIDGITKDAANAGGFACTKDNKLLQCLHNKFIVIQDCIKNNLICASVPNTHRDGVSVGCQFKNGGNSPSSRIDNARNCKK